MAIAARKFFVLAIYMVFANGIMRMTIRTANGLTDAPIFIFGDSTVDVGTNNHLEECTAKANHPNHGIDFPFSVPTGRSSNGRNVADEIVRLLGNYKLSPPPFLSLLTNKRRFRRNLLRGVNFASGGAGVFKETGHIIFGDIHGGASPSWTVQQLATVRGNITELLRSPKAVNDVLQNSTYILSIGNNDLIEYAATFRKTPPDPIHFIANLTQAYAAHLVNMYKLGARKFAIVGIPPIGCAPASRVFNTTGGCIDVENDIVRLFYTSMQSILTGFSLKLKGFKYSLGNSYALTMNVIDNALANGFKDVTKPCCGNGIEHCDPGVSLCMNRDDFLFWDRFHSTEKASRLAALTFVYGEGPEFVSPMNFSSLAMIHDL